MINKYFILMTLLIISFSSGAVQNLGVFERGEDINLIQICDSCTYNNITRILYPNSTEAINVETVMLKDGIYYNYNFYDTLTLGRYVVVGHGNLEGVDTIWIYDFEVTQTGTIFNIQSAILSSILIFVLILFLGLIMFGYYSVPGNVRDDKGYVLEVSKLAYLKPILLGLAWIMLTSIMFISANIAVGYLTTGLLGSFLFAIWQIMLISNFIIIPLMVIFMIQRIVLSKEMMGLVERGVEFK